MQSNRQQRRAKGELIRGLLFDPGTRVPYNDVNKKPAKPNEGHSKKIRTSTKNK